MEERKNMNGSNGTGGTTAGPCCTTSPSMSGEGFSPEFCGFVGPQPYPGYSSFNLKNAMAVSILPEVNTKCL